MTQSSRPAEVPPGAAPPAGPSSNARTVITFLLIVHLFSLSLVFVLNGNSTTARQQLRRVPGMYLRLLAMDFDLDVGTPSIPLEIASPVNEYKSRRALYHLTQGEVTDVGCFVEVNFEKGGQPQTVRIPSDDMRGYRLRHYQMLAWEAGRMIGSDEQNVLPGAIAVALLRENGVAPDAAEGLPQVRVERMALQLPSEATSPDPTRRDPWHSSRFIQLYQANLLGISDGEPLMQEVSEARDAAPAAPSSASPPPGESSSPAAGSEPAAASSSAASPPASPAASRRINLDDAPPPRPSSNRFQLPND